MSDRWSASVSWAHKVAQLAVLVLALAAVAAQETLSDSLAVAATAIVLAPVAAFGEPSSSVPLPAVALAAVLAVGAMTVATGERRLSHVVLAVIAAAGFTMLYRIAPADSSPVSIFVALVVGGLAGRFGWEWGALALLGGLVVNGVVSVAVLLYDNPSTRTTPMSSVLSVTALVAALSRPYLER